MPINDRIRVWCLFSFLFGCITHCLLPRTKNKDKINKNRLKFFQVIKFQALYCSFRSIFRIYYFFSKHVSCCLLIVAMVAVFFLLIDGRLKLFLTFALWLHQVLWYQRPVKTLSCYQSQNHNGKNLWIFTRRS